MSVRINHGDEIDKVLAAHLSPDRARAVRPRIFELEPFRRISNQVGWFERRLNDHLDVRVPGTHDAEAFDRDFLDTIEEVARIASVLTLAAEAGRNVVSAMQAQYDAMTAPPAPAPPRATPAAIEPTPTPTMTTTEATVETEEEETPDEGDAVGSADGKSPRGRKRT